MNDLTQRLAALAASGETISYGALAQALGWRVSHLTAALESLMEQDARTGQPLRAALLAGRLSQGLPAPGFFAKAAELGYHITDPAAFVADHRARLRASTTLS